MTAPDGRGARILGEIGTEDAPAAWSDWADVDWPPGDPEVKKDSDSRAGRAILAALASDTSNSSWTESYDENEVWIDSR